MNTQDTWIPALWRAAVALAQGAGVPLVTAAATATASWYGWQAALDLAYPPVEKAIIKGFNEVKASAMDYQLGDYTVFQWFSIARNLWATLEEICDRVVYFDICAQAAQHAITIYVLSYLLLWILSFQIRVFKTATSIASGTIR